MVSSEIREIRDKLTSHGWPKFIEQIKIDHLHGFNSQVIEFKFPVCAIVGENGTGKSTILKILACIYRSESLKKTYFPSHFFPDTVWEKSKNVQIEYVLREGQGRKVSTIRKPTRR